MPKKLIHEQAPLCECGKRPVITGKKPNYRTCRGCGNNYFLVNGELVLIPKKKENPFPKEVRKGWNPLYMTPEQYEESVS